MLSVLIYVAYVVLRAFAGGGEAERKFAAALGVLGAANLPIIHFSVQKWGGNHPKVITSGGGGLQHPDMKLAFAPGLPRVHAPRGGPPALVARARIDLADGRLAELEQEALELGLGEE
jgi:heme exporter protein C